MRATTLSPRSWPSSPSLAKTMRTGPPCGARNRDSLRVTTLAPAPLAHARQPRLATGARFVSPGRSLGPGAEHALEGPADLAHRGPGLDGLDHRRQAVDGRVGGLLADPLQGPVDVGAVPAGPHGGQALELGGLDVGADAQDLGGPVVTVRVTVDPHDDPLPRVHLPLVAVGGVGDLVHDPAVVDGL